MIKEPHKDRTLSNSSLSLFLDLCLFLFLKYAHIHTLQTSLIQDILKMWIQEWIKWFIMIILLKIQGFYNCGRKSRRIFHYLSALKEQNPVGIKSFNMASVGVANHNIEVCVYGFYATVSVSVLFSSLTKTKAKTTSQQN